MTAVPALVTGGLVALAVLAAAPPRPVVAGLVAVLPRGGRGTHGPLAGRRSARPLALVPATTAVVVLGALVVVAPALVVPVVAGAVVVAGAAALVAGRRRHRAATATEAAVLGCCDLVAAELAAGRPPLLALRSVAREWPPAAAVVVAHDVGTDPAAAWRRLARAPGAGDLVLLAAAWQVSGASGAGLAATTARVAQLARARAATRRLVASELSSARSTARLVAALPVVALLLGSGLGDPWSFLLGTPAGQGCLLGGLGLGAAGLAWLERIAAGVLRDAS